MQPMEAHPEVNYSVLVPMQQFLVHSVGTSSDNFVSSSEMTNSQDAMEQIKREHQALAILRVLHRAPGYRCNDAVLANYLDRLALGGTREAIKASLNFLEQSGLLKTDSQEGFVVVCITQRGDDVALDKLTVDGVLRPGPECLY
jgi:hypothetical protein